MNGVCILAIIRIRSSNNCKIWKFNENLRIATEHRIAKSKNSGDLSKVKRGVCQLNFLLYSRINLVSKVLMIIAYMVT